MRSQVQFLHRPPLETQPSAAALPFSSLSFLSSSIRALRVHSRPSGFCYQIAICFFSCSIAATRIFICVHLCKSVAHLLLVLLTAICFSYQPPLQISSASSVLKVLVLPIAICFSSRSFAATLLSSAFICANL